MEKKNYFTWFAVLAGIYVALALLSPVDPATLSRYNISTVQVKLLLLSIAVPYLAIWYAAFYGFIKLKEYVALISKNPDGKAWDSIADGLMVLAFGLPLSAILSQAFNFLLEESAEYARTSTLVTSYTNIIIAAVAFTLISRGAHKLIAMTRKAAKPADGPWYVLLFLMIASTYTYTALFATNTSETGSNSIYSIPRVVMIITVLLPYLYIWYKGLLSAFYLHHFKKNVPGTLYREGLRFLSYGIIGVIVSSVILQFFATKSGRLINFRLAVLMTIIYGLLATLALGYGLLAVGAKRLKKIEEV